VCVVRDDAAARTTLQWLLGRAPGGTSARRRLVALAAYTRLLRPVVGLPAAAVPVDVIVATPRYTQRTSLHLHLPPCLAPDPDHGGGNRRTNGVAAYQTEATLLAQLVEWLLTVRQTQPIELVNAVVAAAIDVLEAVANTPTLVQVRPSPRLALRCYFLLLLLWLLLLTLCRWRCTGVRDGAACGDAAAERARRCSCHSRPGGTLCARAARPSAVCLYKCVCMCACVCVHLFLSESLCAS
jgi:hypothetical protein